MMKYIIFLFLIVFHSINSKTPVKSGNTKKNCQDIKCPSVDEPVCARVTSMDNKNKTIYIIMVNQCEMEYMKCHKGLQANVVNMKYCGHEDYQTLHKLLNDKGRKRSKRDTNYPSIIKIHREAPRKKLVGRSDNTSLITAKDARGDIVVSPDNGIDDETSQPDENHYGFADTAGSDEVNTAKHLASYETTPPNVIDSVESEEVAPNELAGVTDSSMDVGVVQVLPDKQQVLPVSEQDVQESDAVGEIKQQAESGQVIIDAPVGEPESVSGENSGHLSEVLEKQMKFSDKTIFKDNRVQNDAEPSAYDEYLADCPTSCPSRDVMVCAKCQHGIYKTFMSICHMRMFSCWFKDESLELVSRYPCVMSAPFLSTKPNTVPKSMIGLPDDEDRILKFIYCREKGDPSFMEERNKLSYSENSHVYPNCDLNINTKRKLRSKPVERDVYSTY